MKKQLLIIAAFVIAIQLTGCAAFKPGQFVLATKGEIAEKDTTIIDLSSRNAELKEIIDKNKRSEKRKIAAALKLLQKSYDKLLEVEEPLVTTNAIIYNNKVYINETHIWITKDAIHIANIVDNIPISLNTIPIVNLLNK